MCLKEIPSSNRGAQGGVGLVTKERPNGWGIESTRFHGPNMVNFRYSPVLPGPHSLVRTFPLQHWNTCQTLRRHYSGLRAGIPLS